ncbi:phosphohydrolase [Clostridium tetani]|uniref:Phosphohydrolase n=1 Tax=Clostridium tetani TaxID=1513 RepID=A0A4Q0VAM3_CLOTA|nr:HD domain-containing protein [Clostridium tetani]RXI45363.1 phosphohydrolase [Clostridium tetani]BDR66270.1 phosphohydrolase [Clostridium tetani]BDR80246.1 phosphohydrolase [Clostridium tetani]BDR88696.1 phosphohydrolase [Clostridium tetani]
MEEKHTIFKNIEKHLLQDENPSEYLNKLSEEGLLKEYPFNLLDNLKKTDQNLTHHPEGNVWNHTMMVLDRAAKNKEFSEDSKAFMWAALLHDIGKGTTTKIRRGKITSYNHDKEGEFLSIKFLEEFTEDKEFIKKVAALVRWHMQPLFVSKKMSFADIDGMKKECSPEEIALLSKCDRLGRGDMNEDRIKKEEEDIEVFLNAAKKESTKK